MDFSKICNYQEETKQSQPTIALSYIDMVTEEDDFYYRELKRSNRDLAIDIILDEKNESEWENRNKLPDLPFCSTVSTPTSSISTMSMQVFNVNTRALKFTNNSDLEYEIFNKLENLTKNQPNTKSGVNLNMGIPSVSEDYETFSRRIYSKIMACSNLIAMNSRQGAATTVIVGTNILGYINSTSSYNMGFDLVISSFIDPDKIIVMKTGKIGVGLNVILNTTDNMYYMVETPNSWEKVIKWFWIK